MMNTLTANVGTWALLAVLVLLLLVAVVIAHERDPHEKPWFQEHPHWLQELIRHPWDLTKEEEK